MGKPPFALRDLLTSFLGGYPQGGLLHRFILETKSQNVRETPVDPPDDVQRRPDVYSEVATGTLHGFRETISLTSGEYRCGLAMSTSFEETESPASPGRFTYRSAALEQEEPPAGHAGGSYGGTQRYCSGYRR